jgi:5-formyltetrahydrofolate cyclo-ligase
VANTPPTTKTELRRAARERRRATDPGTGEALRDAVLSLPELEGARVVTAYVARSGEPDTAPLLAALADRGIQVLQPVLLPDFDLDWAVDDGTRLTSSVHGSLSEPTSRRLGPEAIRTADVVLVPALAVDRDGTRLGNGGGCYDRALARVAPGVLVAALLHDDELSAEPLPAEPHDRPVDAVVTPSGVRRLSRLRG